MSAMKSVSSVYGILVGLAGVEHGILEILQGNTPTDGFLIDAIGDAYRFWPGAGERALTIVANFLWTGVLAVVFGVLVTMWAAKFVERNRGASVLLVLTMSLFLVGGGFAPIVMSIIAVIAATRIGAPLGWWRSHISGSSRVILTGLWPWVLTLFVLIFWSTVAIQIFGLPLPTEAVTSVVGTLTVVLVLLMVSVPVVGAAYDSGA